MFEGGGSDGSDELQEHTKIVGNVLKVFGILQENLIAKRGLDDNTNTTTEHIIYKSFKVLNHLIESQPRVVAMRADGQPKPSRQFQRMRFEALSLAERLIHVHIVTYSKITVFRTPEGHGRNQLLYHKIRAFLCGWLKKIKEREPTGFQRIIHTIFKICNGLILLISDDEGLREKAQSNEYVRYTNTERTRFIILLADFITILKKNGSPPVVKEVAELEDFDLTFDNDPGIILNIFAGLINVLIDLSVDMTTFNTADIYAYDLSEMLINALLVDNCAVLCFILKLHNSVLDFENLNYTTNNLNAIQVYLESLQFLTAFVFQAPNKLASETIEESWSRVNYVTCELYTNEAKDSMEFVTTREALTQLLVSALTQLAETNRESILLEQHLPLYIRENIFIINQSHFTPYYFTLTRQAFDRRFIEAPSFSDQWLSLFVEAILRESKDIEADLKAAQDSFEAMDIPMENEINQKDLFQVTSSASSVNASQRSLPNLDSQEYTEETSAPTNSWHSILYHRAIAELETAFPTDPEEKLLKINNLLKVALAAEVVKHFKKGFAAHQKEIKEINQLLRNYFNSLLQSALPRTVHKSALMLITDFCRFSAYLQNEYSDISETFQVMSRVISAPWADELPAELGLPSTDSVLIDSEYKIFCFMAIGYLGFEFMVLKDAILERSLIPHNELCKEKEFWQALPYYFQSIETDERFRQYFQLISEDPTFLKAAAEMICSRNLYLQNEVEGEFEYFPFQLTCMHNRRDKFFTPVKVPWYLDPLEILDELRKHNHYAVITDFLKNFAVHHGFNEALLLYLFKHLNDRRFSTQLDSLWNQIGHGLNQLEQAQIESCFTAVLEPLLEEPNHEVYRVVLQIIAKLASVVDSNKIFIEIIMLFLKFSLLKKKEGQDPNEHPFPKAQEIFAKLCNAREESIYSILQKVMEEITRKFLDFVIQSKIRNCYRRIQFITNAFDDKGNFLALCVTHLAQNHNQETLALFKQQLEVDFFNIDDALIDQAFPCICTYVIQNQKSEEKIKELFTRILPTYHQGFNFSKMVKSQPGVINDILELYNQHEHTLFVIGLVYKYRADGRTHSSSDSLLRTFKQDHTLLGYIGKIQRDFDKKSTEHICSKIESVYSLTKLLNHFGSTLIDELLDNIIKLLNILFQHVLRSQIIRKAFLCLNEALILNISSQVINTYLVEIFRNLVGLTFVDLNVYKKLVEVLMKKMDHKHPKLERVDRLIQDNEYTKEIKYTLKMLIKQMPNASTTLEKMIKQLIDDICDASDNDTKGLYLDELRVIIENSYQELTKLQDNRVSRTLNYVMARLFCLTRSSDDEVKTKLAACLGSIGAIDPGLFEYDLPYFFEADNWRTGSISFDLTSDVFRTSLLTRIYQLSTNTESEKQLRSQFVIQELLKCFGIRNASSPALKQLNEQVQQACIPLLTTQYQYPDSIEPPPKAESIAMYRNTNKDEWLKAWTRSLIAKIKGRESRKVFEFCSICFDIDLKIAEWLLPCIIFQLLKTGDQKANENFNSIVDEIKYLVEPVTSILTGAPLAKTSFDDCQISVTNFTLTESDHFYGRILFRICESFEMALLKNNNEPVKQFLEKIPKDSLAHFAYACGAYARSIKYCEESLKTPSFRDPNEPPKETKVPSVNDFELLQKNYVALNDTDSVIGITLKHPNAKAVHNELMLHEAKGDLQDALSYCERASQKNRADLGLAKKFVRTLMALDQYFTADLYLKGLIDQTPQWKTNMYSYQVKAAYRLSNWDELEKLLNRNLSETSSKNVGIGRAILHLHKTANLESGFGGIELKEKLFDIVNSVRLHELISLASASHERGGYSRAYKQMTNLQILSDLGSMISPRGPNSDEYSVSLNDQLYKRWQLRNSLVQKSWRTMEPILSLQRVLYKISPDPDGVKNLRLADSLLESAKLSRKEHNIQGAYNCILEIDQTIPENLIESNYKLASKIVIERAKLNWTKGDADSRENAVKILGNGVRQYFMKHDPEATKITNQMYDNDSREYLANILHLEAKYKDESRSASSSTILKCYQEVLKINPNFEEGHFTLARYHDKMGQAIRDHIRNSPYTDSNDDRKESMSKLADYVKCMHEASNSLKNTLLIGDRHCQEGISRLMSIYFEFGALFTPTNDDPIGKRINEVRIPPQNLIGTYHAFIETNLKEIYNKKPNLFMLVLLQIVSRLLHPHKGTSKCLRSIISDLLRAYPHQAIWLIIGTVNTTLTIGSGSQKEERPTDLAKQCMDLINRTYPKPSRLGQNNHFVLWQLYQSFVRAVINVAELNVPKVGGHTLEEKDASILSFLRKNTDSIMLPSKSQMRVPINGPSTEQPEQKVMISAVEKQIWIFRSLARPKRLTFIGSDGKKYRMLSKPKDDTRLDQRFMEFAEEVNRLLRRNRQARKRDLKIRTYGVIPLSKDCGLIEWLDGLTDMRSTLLKAYRTYSKIEDKQLAEIKKLVESHSKDYTKRTSINVKQQYTVFVEHVMPCVTPPRLSNWFFDNFPDPTEWYRARNKFSQSCAVMSMVGYIMGLGDRHLENIMLDTLTGEVVHVDFNCLFNGGEQLLIPELVPFRLTHNMVDAMGITGYEGVFRKTCEVVLQLMRDNRDSLLSLLEPFVYDPLLREAQKNPRAQAPSSCSQIDYQKGVEFKNLESARHLLKIRYRLEGLVSEEVISDTKTSKIPLSVPGQVQHLIEQATSLKNLSQMFIGWASFF